MPTTGWAVSRANPALSRWCMATTRGTLSGIAGRPIRSREDGEKNAHAIALKRIEESERTCESRLDLSDLRLGALPPEIGKLKNLSILYLQFNQLTSLPPEIGQLTSLSTLHLNDNQLSSLPPEIGKLSNLTELDLDNNQISSLPRILGELAKLTRLDIDGNGLLSIPPQIGNLVELAFLYARRNRLSSLPADIGNLTNLTLLDLGANQLSSLPQELGNIKNLTTLDLDENQLLSLPPEIGKLTNLETLHLRDNQLSELPPELGDLQNLTTLNLANNRLSDAITAAKERGTRELLAYLRSLKEGEALYESKLVLVGEGDVGKTSLVEAMKGEPFREGRPTTHGIEISQLDLPHPHLEETVRLNAWDFGGQPVYRVKHQFFFSRRSIFCSGRRAWASSSATSRGGSSESSSASATRRGSSSWPRTARPKDASLALTRNSSNVTTVI